MQETKGPRPALARLAIVALLVFAACGDVAEPTTTTPSATTVPAPPITTLPPASTTTAPSATVTTAATAELVDLAAVDDCDGLVSAGIVLIQAVLDGFGATTLDEYAAAAEDPPVLALLDEEGPRIDARADELGCDSAALEAGLLARAGELAASGELGELFLAGLVEELPDTEATAPEGVDYYDVADATHTEEPVTYPEDPPVGGPHHPVWLNCGVYAEPVVVEHAVHSLEHGAVWITYDPAALSDADVAMLRGLATGSKVIVSPYPLTGEPVVASAWGAQLRLDSADDPRLFEFVDALVDALAPEPGGPCEDGIGEPE